MKPLRTVVAFFLFALLAASLCGCFGSVDEGSAAVSPASAGVSPRLSGDAVAKQPVQGIGDTPLQDNLALYTADQGDSIVTMYLTVSRGAESENTNHSWNEINSHSKYDYEKMGVDPYLVEGLLQVGDENGPVSGEFGYGQQIPNATVQIRGSTSSLGPQKSYKITLDPKAGDWRQQRIIVLNKHIYDDLRFRNKLCYDLTEGIPGLISFRTQFVHLYVKDDTDMTSTKFVDYGLFTQIEQPNKRFLKNHDLDDYGQFYKVNFFEFHSYPDAIMLKTDPNYDEKKFESYLKIRGSDDHTKLLEMIDDVNDYSEPIEGVFEEYFDPENYFTWIAFNILISNTDTQSQNYLLYSPLQSSKWYFVNWDCDGSFFRYSDDKTDLSQIGYEFGVSDYWGNVLFNRVMRVPKYRKMLDDKVEALMKILTPERIYALTKSYRSVMERFLFQMPDMMHIHKTQQQYDEECDKLSQEIQLNYNLYKLSLKTPMPFFADPPVYSNGSAKFSWQVSYDFDGQDITYTFELAQDCTFQQAISKQENLLLPTATVSNLSPGKYFYRVTAVTSDGYTQTLFGKYEWNNVKYFGTQSFYILPDGSVKMDENNS